MNDSEYVQAVKRIRKECQDKLQILWDDYAMERNTLKVGDIVGLQEYSVCVDKIDIVDIANWRFPQWVYYCVILTKKGTPNKRNKRARFGASMIKSINGEVFDEKSA